MSVEDAVVYYNERIAGLLTITRIGREWHWTWVRPDHEIVLGAAPKELDAANAAGAAIIDYYDRAH